ncbi:MAG: hypothetical protein ABI234_19250 [Ktedonobacteraceae bacterium]
MRYHDAKRGVPTQRDAHLVQPVEPSGATDVRDPFCSSEQDASLLETPPVRVLYPGISTERIMHAVERQRRITQQLDDLRVQQQARTVFLRTTCLKLMAWVGGSVGLLVSVLLVLFILQPVLLVRVLTLLSGFIAFLLAVGVGMQTDLPLVSSNNWVLSGVALAVVLMMAMWLRLMRYPREA